MIYNPLLIILVVSSIAAIIFLYSTVGLVAKFRIIRAIRMVLPTLVCLSIAGLSATLLIANHGYRIFTREAHAATVIVSPQGVKRFSAHVILPDSSKFEYDIAGDMLYVDAHILKWNPLLNLAGVHTTYELDRIGGRYVSLKDEKEKPRTIYSIAKKKYFNMYTLRMRYGFLKPFLDAEYGSATFVEIRNATTFQILVSTSGLLIRY